MHKKHNFGAGPCILPSSVMEQAAQAVINWGGMGLSILEVSHRSPEFEDVVLKTQLLVRELLSVPDHYSVLFLQGGASTQFAMVPMNFLSEGKKAAYLDTGYFAQKAIKEAKLFGEVELVASSKDKDYAYIPVDFNNDKQAAYLHCTSNNTIEGTEIFDFPTAGAPLICDMSSDIFSRKINITDFDLVYAGAQKNMWSLLKMNSLTRPKKKFHQCWIIGYSAIIWACTIPRRFFLFMCPCLIYCG